MASMKTRIITHINQIITDEGSDEAFAQMAANLTRLGASQDIIDGASASRKAMQVELPKLVAWITSNCRAKDSLTTIITSAGAAGFSPEALYAIRAD